MRLIANVITSIVIILSMFNTAERNNIMIDVITSLLLLATSLYFATNKSQRVFIIASLVFACFCWKHQQYDVLSNISDVTITLCFFLCTPTNASLLLCMESVINILLRAINPSLFILAEIIDICICLYLFYDARQVLSTYFPKLWNNDGFRAN